MPLPRTRPAPWRCTCRRSTGASRRWASCLGSNFTANRRVRHATRAWRPGSTTRPPCPRRARASAPASRRRCTWAWRAPCSAGATERPGTTSFPWTTAGRDRWKGPTRGGRKSRVLVVQVLVTVHYELEQEQEPRQITWPPTRRASRAASRGWRTTWRGRGKAKSVSAGPRRCRARGRAPQAPASPSTSGCTPTWDRARATPARATAAASSTRRAT